MEVILKIKAIELTDELVEFLRSEAYADEIEISLKMNNKKVALEILPLVDQYQAKRKKMNELIQQKEQEQEEELLEELERRKQMIAAQQKKKE